MQPHGAGETFLQAPSQSNQVNGPTLQAIASDNEQPQQRAKGPRGARRVKSMAYGTLETIMSSSRSSEEEKSKKKSAAALAEEVRGRSISNAARKDTDPGTSAEQTGSEGTRSSGKIVLHRPIRHRRSKSVPFASLVIDNAQNIKHDSTKPKIALPSPKTPALTSAPAQPKTSTIAEFPGTPSSKATPEPFPAFDPIGYSKPSMIRNQSIASTLAPEPERHTSIFSGFSSWIPWVRSVSMQGGATARRPSYAEGSLRHLLRGSEGDRKGKGVDRVV